MRGAGPMAARLRMVGSASAAAAGLVASAARRGGWLGCVGMRSASWDPLVPWADACRRRLSAPALSRMPPLQPSQPQHQKQPQKQPLGRHAAIKPTLATRMHPSPPPPPASSQSDVPPPPGTLEHQKLPPRVAVTPKKKKSVRDVCSDDEFVPAPIGMISAPAPQALRVTALCLAERFNLKRLHETLQDTYTVLPYMVDDIVHVQLTPPAARDDHAGGASDGHGREGCRSKSAVTSSETNGEAGTVSTSATPVDAVSNADTPQAFVFANGTLAVWGATEAQTESLVKSIRSCEENGYVSIESEWFDYFEDPTSPSGIASDVIIIGNDLPSDQAKLAFSSGLTRSVKLSSLESLLDEHLSRSRNIPDLLLRGKRLPFGRAAILRNLGELFWLRAHVNLHSEMLDSPDFCWSSSRMEGLFERVSRNLDVRPRIAIFNKKLDYANEIAEMLRSHLHEQHSLKLEWCIIILISVEIAFEFVHYYERVFV